MSVVTGNRESAYDEFGHSTYQGPSFQNGMLSPISPMTSRQADGDINIKPGRIPLSPGGKSSRPFFDRAFGKLEKGSIRGSIFSLCSAAIGGGILSLPYMFCLSGYLTGAFLIVIGTIAGIWSNLLLAEMADTYKLKNLD